MFFPRFLNFPLKKPREGGGNPKLLQTRAEVQR